MVRRVGFILDEIGKFLEVFKWGKSFDVIDILKMFWEELMVVGLEWIGSSVDMVMMEGVW